MPKKTSKKTNKNKKYEKPVSLYATRVNLSDQTAFKLHYNG